MAIEKKNTLINVVDFTTERLIEMKKAASASGDKIEVDGITIIPVSKVSIGFAGGGMLAVPFLKSQGFEQKAAHKNAVAVILPITLVSAVMYAVRGYVDIKDAYLYIPTGIIGSLFGTFLIKKISAKFLKVAFSAFMVYAGVRLLLK